jgi:hypothetical protein
MSLHGVEKTYTFQIYLLLRLQDADNEESTFLRDNVPHIALYTLHTGRQ